MACMVRGTWRVVNGLRCEGAALPRYRLGYRRHVRGLTPSGLLPFLQKLPHQVGGSAIGGPGPHLLRAVHCMVQPGITPLLAGLGEGGASRRKLLLPPERESVVFRCHAVS